MRGHTQRLYQVFPIALQIGGDGRGIGAADIVLYGEHAPVAARGGHHVLQHHVAGSAVSRNVGDEALEQHAIQPVLLHPAEAAGHGLAVARREEPCRLGADSHVGHRAEFIGIELAQVRIHVDGERGGGWRAVGPVAPVGARGAAGAAKQPW